MGLKRTVAPASLAIDLAQAKKQVELGESDTAHDDHVQRVVLASIADVERYTRRAFITQQFRLTLDELRERVPLPRPPAVSVQSVQYRDADGVWQTHPSSNYELLNEESPATVYFELLPWSNSVIPQSYRINYTAGFGASHTDVPDEYKNVIYELVAFRLLNRGDVDSSFPKQIKMALDALKCGARLGYYEMKDED
jgi:uncharacterized phiE125 gp8 family phage protein